MKVIKKVFAFLFLGIIILGQLTELKAFEIKPVTYHIKMYGTIYNAKGKVVEKNAMFERSYTFSENVNTYLYSGQKDDPTRFDLGKKQTIILNYVEVNGRKTEVKIHPDNPLRANLIYDDLYFDYDSSNANAPENLFTIRLFRKIPIVVTAKNMTTTYDGTEKELSGFDITAGSLRTGHRVVVQNESILATESGKYILNPEEAKAYDKNDNDVSYLYQFYYESGSLTIYPAPITITIDNVEKTTGNDDPDFTATVEGEIEGNALDYTLIRESGEELGEYPITAHYAENKNYIVNIIEGKLSILAAIVNQPNDEEPPLADIEVPTVPEINGPVETNGPIETPEEILVNPSPNPQNLIREPTRIETPVVNTPVQNNNQPQEENNKIEEVITVNDNKTPLAGSQNSWALVNLIAVVTTVILGIVIILLKKTKESAEEENVIYKNRYTWMKLLGTVIAIISVVIFILTEDIALPMVMLDKYTVVMVVIAIIQFVVFFTHTIVKKKVNKQISQA